MLKELRGQEFNIKRAEKRVLDAKESARRKSKRFFKLQMNAIAHRQAQCVAVPCVSVPVTSQSLPCLCHAGLRSGHFRHVSKPASSVQPSPYYQLTSIWVLEAPYSPAWSLHCASTWLG